MQAQDHRGHVTLRSLRREPHLWANTTPPSTIGDGSDKIEPSRASRSPLEAAKADQLSGTSELGKTCLMMLTRSNKCRRLKLLTSGTLGTLRKGLSLVGSNEPELSWRLGLTSKESGLLETYNCNVEECFLDIYLDASRQEDISSPAETGRS
ncbi:hypothetical protein CT0861_02510 [Colletotrichum tofieldiae]|uniref:Uncharacterized protein n=1 Tax=Colletotrichum tofieldiae TaxID=708197 RepID=A0A166NHU1_9PEZI|nr:hypothetical protein CT0861_02510 [Colletotrichum tofieldiae]